MAEYIEKPDMQYILHIKSNKKVEKRLIDYCLVSVTDVFEDTGLTADVQPIKLGRWIGITEYCKKNGYIPSGMGIYYWCSECDKEEQKTSDFCPNCGARMDGEQNE